MIENANIFADEPQMVNLHEIQKLGLLPELADELGMDLDEIRVHVDEYLAREFLDRPWGSARDHYRPRKPKPSPLIARAAEHGLKRWHLSHGLPNRVADLARLEAFFVHAGVLAESEVGEPVGAWRLRLDDFNIDLSARQSLKLLDAAGDCPEQLLDILRLSLRYVPTNVLLPWAKRIRTPLAFRRMRDILDWGKHHQLMLYGWAPEVLLLLAKQPEDLRWALLHGNKTKPKAGIRGLNWNAYRQAKSSLPARLSYLPPHAIWERALGAPAPEGVILPSLHGFKFSTLTRLSAEFGLSLAEPDQPQGKDLLDDWIEQTRLSNAFVELGALRRPAGDAPVHGWLSAFVHLVRLFGDYGSIRRFVTQRHPWTMQGLHDAGQFRLPTAHKWTPSRWAPLCLRHPEAVEYAQHFATLERRKKISCLSDLRKAVLRSAYTGVTERWVPLADLCLEANMSEHEFRNYKNFWQNVSTKPADCMPYVQIDGGTIGLPGWRLVKLADSDFRGPMLGSLTGCCQHLTGMGKACAIHGVTSPYSAFFVVLRNGNVVAQSWAWRTENGGVVLDSVEARDRSSDVVNATARLLKAAAPQFLAAGLGINSLFIGDTSSGITRRVRDELGAGDKVYCESPADACTYYDGRSHRLVAGKVAARSQDLPEIEGYTTGQPLSKVNPEEVAVRFIRGRDGNHWLERAELEDMDLLFRAQQLW